MRITSNWMPELPSRRNTRYRLRFDADRRTLSSVLIDCDADTGVSYDLSIERQGITIISEPVANDSGSDPMRALVAEDDSSIAAGLCAALRSSGHVVDEVGNGALADGALRDHDYDLVVLDLGLPSLDGAEVLTRLRQRGGRTAVLVVTAREGLRERVRVLDLGADDYLVKPFALAEFEARVRALLRRAASHGKPELLLGLLRLDLPGRRAWVGHAALELTPREFGLLEALVLRGDRVSSRSHLIDALCSWDQELTDNGLDIAIHRLRKKLQDTGTQLRTIRGIGYLLEESVDDGG